MPQTREELAQLLDYANLEVDARDSDIRLLCLEAEKHGIPTVLVNPVNVALASSFVRGTNVKVAGAVSYPVGAYTPAIKELEVEDAVDNGADEIVMLMAVGVFLDGLHEQTRAEMEGLVRAARGRTTKLIIEVAALSDEQKELACRMAIDAGIDYVMTSTGFAPGGFSGATVADVELLAKAAAGKIGIVASGDILITDQALAMLGGGASRICTPAARDILEGFVQGQNRPKGY
jgi:deoxyribose-phosphate aldolase